MSSELRTCQNCKKDFGVEPADLDFYAKMQVPPPTFCPQCRMVRRMIWRNQRHLFRRKDSRTGKDIFSMYDNEARATVYDRDFWYSDAWDPMQYGKEYDFSKPFFAQLKELLDVVPQPSRAVLNSTNSDYSMNLADAKNAYLCFDGNNITDSAYVVGFVHVAQGFDLYQTRHSEMCYEGYMIDECSKIFFSVNTEDSHDIWFSKNMIGCMNCFGCINLRNKSYHIWNQPVSKEEYRKFMADFRSGSYEAVSDMRTKAEAFWLKYPHRFTLAINVQDSSGEHIEHTKNVKDSYFVHEAKDLRFCQDLQKVNDSYDATGGGTAERLYEAVNSYHQAENIRFSWLCHTASHSEEYSLNCMASHDLFGCIGLDKKEYCILNKQYSKEEFIKMRKKIIAHMNEMPYTDQKGIIYKYGEFLPSEFSPFAYNDTIAQDFAPLTKKEALKAGYRWHEVDAKEYETTLQASDLPDTVEAVTDAVLAEVIKCADCGRAYRIIASELQFYRQIPLPLPRHCPQCRFQRRFGFVNPPRFRHDKCHCAGRASDNGLYENINAIHPTHAADEPCPEEFETSYPEGCPEFTYCASCYQAETI